MALGTFRHSFFRLPDANTANSTSHILRKNQGFYRCVGHRRHINTSRHHGTATVTTAASLISGSSSSPMVPAKNDSRSETTVQSTLSPQRTLQSLSLLPFSSLLRGWVISAVTSSPAFLPLSIWLLRTVAYTKSPVLSADSNPIVRWLLKKTIYAQFCAGENVSEVKATIAQLRKQGVDGVLLGCGKELEVRRENAADEGKVESKHALAMERENDDAELEVKEWERCTLETIAMAPEGDFVSIKLTGAGPLTRHALSHSTPPPHAVSEAMSRFATLARSRRVSLGIDAEQTHFQSGINSWVIDWAAKYNRRITPTPSPSSPQDPRSSSTSPHLNSTENLYTCIYNTYQAYLRSTPNVLASHLFRAQKEGIVLGVKLVRGAYLASEPQDLPWGSKEATDAAYDQIAESIVRRHWGGVLGVAAEEIGRTERDGERLNKERGFPEVTFLLATHNLASVRKIMGIRQAQAENGERRVPMVYAQLMGMADHVTGELVASAQQARKAGHTALAAMEDGEARKVGVMAKEKRENVEVPKVWKYLVWGGVGECAKYLVRRAEENRDAVGRTGEARREFGREVRRRVKGLVTG